MLVPLIGMNILQTQDLYVEGDPLPAFLGDRGSPPKPDRLMTVLHSMIPTGVDLLLGIWLVACLPYQGSTPVPKTASLLQPMMLWQTWDYTVDSHNSLSVPGNGCIISYNHAVEKREEVGEDKSQAAEVTIKGGALFILPWLTGMEASSFQFTRDVSSGDLPQARKETPWDWTMWLLAAALWDSLNRKLGFHLDRTGWAMLADPGEMTLHSIQPTSNPPHVISNITDSIVDGWWKATSWMDHSRTTLVQL